MYPHRIQLRGPWDCEPLARTLMHSDGRIETLDGPVPAARRMTMPCQWAEGGLGPFTGRVRFRRRFHWTKPLGSHERLWLTFAGADYFTEVRLNGEELGRHAGAFDPFEFEITSLVRTTNELVVDVDLPGVTDDAAANPQMLRASAVCPPDSGGLWGVVAVEVRREWFLRSVGLEASFALPSPALCVTGKVAGAPGRSLELYVLCDDRTISYTRVESGRPFHVTTSPLAVERWWPRGAGPAKLYEIRVELIDGASKLHELIRPFGFREIGEDMQEGRLNVNGCEVQLRSDEPESNFMSTDLPAPGSDLYDRADREGKLVATRLPIPERIANDPAVRAEADRQARAIITGLQYHPCVLDWYRAGVSDASQKRR